MSLFSAAPDKDFSETGALKTKPMQAEDFRDDSGNLARQPASKGWFGAYKPA